MMHAYSRDELTAKMTRWMVETYGHPMKLTKASRCRWMKRNGMLYAFICDHFPAENAPTLARAGEDTASTNQQPTARCQQ